MQAFFIYLMPRALHSQKNMRKASFLLFGCLKVLFASASSYHTDSLRHYYTHVHKAEHLIIMGDYPNAVKSYDSAFAFSAHPFAGDVYNKLKCCIVVKDYKAAQCESERLITKGAQLQFFSTTFYDGFRNSKAYSQLAAHYPALHKKYLGAVDVHEIKQIRMLADADQAVHCSLPALYADTAFVRRMRMNDDSLSLLLTNLLHCDSCLGNEKLGYNFLNDTTLSVAPAYGVIMLHQIQKGGYNFNGLICRAVQQGTLKAEIALSWLSQSGMETVNLTGGYMIFADTLWKLREISHNEGSRRWMAARTKRTDSVLQVFFLNDAYFDVEERVKFNYRQYCRTCRPKADTKFYISPSSVIVGSFKAPAPGEKSYRLADHYNVVEHP